MLQSHHVDTNLLLFWIIVYTNAHLGLMFQKGKKKSLVQHEQTRPFIPPIGRHFIVETKKVF